MKPRSLYRIVFILLTALIFPFNAFSYTAEEVSEWTEETLRTTLIAGFHEDLSEAVNVHRNFKHRAWLSMDELFTEHLHITKPQLFHLEPEAVTPAIILGSDECDAASCWRVHQEFVIADKMMKLDFTALVATADPAYPSPFVIQKLTVVVHYY